VMKDAIGVAINKIEELGIGKKKVNYKMRDAGFSRQRYWGEPFPIVWKDGIAIPLDEKELPLELPHVDSYKPGPDGQGPLATIEEWVGQSLETSTMPGYAGSSWYFLRYMDPDNKETFCDRKISDYWNQVDLYIGGTEHAVGHLLYSRMWTKVLYDLNLIGFDEPYKRLVNQGMIQGVSQYIYRYNFIDDPLNNKRDTNPVAMDKSWPKLEGQFTWFFSAEYKGIEIYRNAFDKILIPIEFVDYKGQVDLSRLAEKKFSKEKVAFVNDSAIFVDNKWTSISNEENNFSFYAEPQVEKMSKSKFNTVNPDDLVAKYGADTFRMYEMFLGPVEMSKPWDTKGIEGVHRFLKKFWRLFFKETKTPPSEGLGEALIVTDDEPTAAELKVLHNTIKKIESDTERFSFNTGYS